MISRVWHPNAGQAMENKVSVALSFLPKNLLSHKILAENVGGKNMVCQKNFSFIKNLARLARLKVMHIT